MRHPLVVLLSDFGMRDWYVAAMRGVILSRCPRAQLLDITHEVPPQDIIAGAFTLAAAAPWFPHGTVFVAVVDPGVGSDRALLAARADGRFFVGPDNGLLALTLRNAKPLTIVQLTNRRYWLKDVSRTFQGRDIIAPVAAYLASGGSLARLGRSLRRMTPLSLPAPERRGRTVSGHIVHIDAFGNLITNLPASYLGPAERPTRPMLHPHLSSHRVGVHPHLSSRVGVRYQRQAVRMVSSYADGRPQELVAMVNALGLVELAIREGSAAWTFNAKRGDQVELTT